MSFWVMREYNGCKYLKSAFRNIQLHDLDFDLSKYWGHTAGTVKVNLMLKLTEVYNSAVTRTTHKEIVQNLDLMIKECDEHLGEVFTSRSHTESFDHHNDEFLFFDASKKKMIKIEQRDRKPLTESFTALKVFRTELMVLISEGKESEAFELVANSEDCLIEFDFYGTAFGFACEQGMILVANKILDKYGAKCFKKEDNYELSKAINYNLDDIALKLLKEFNCIPTIDMLDVAIGSNNRTLCFVLMDLLKDHELKLNGKSSILVSAMYDNTFDLALILIDKFGEKCYPAQVSPYHLNTPLIEACKRKYEMIAIKLIETFGLSKCGAYHVNRYNETAVSIAKINGLDVFVRKFEEVMDKELAEREKLEKEKAEKDEEETLEQLKGKLEKEKSDLEQLKGKLEKEKSDLEQLQEKEKINSPPTSISEFIQSKELKLENAKINKLFEYYNSRDMETYLSKNAVNSNPKKDDIYIYYKGATIKNLEEASTHYLTLVKSNSADADDFKRVIRLFTQ